MKKAFNTQKKVILMVAMIASVIGYANEIGKNPAKDSKKTALTLNNVKQGDQLTIKDTKGLILYSELIEEEGIYAKRFDLSALPNGNYVFELDKDIQIKMIPIVVEENQVIVKKEEANILFKPVTKVKENLVYVSKLALEKEDLQVKIYFDGGNKHFDDYELVFSEIIEDTLCIERVYGLSEKGNYKIVFYTQGREFVEHISN